jgi:hypothetical protein
MLHIVDKTDNSRPQNWHIRQTARGPVPVWRNDTGALVSGLGMTLPEAYRECIKQSKARQKEAAEHAKALKASLDEVRAHTLSGNEAAIWTDCNRG